MIVLSIVAGIAILFLLSGLCWIAANGYTD